MVSPAIVRICQDSEGNRRIGVGVVVSPKGYVAISYRRDLVELGEQQRPLYFFFSDGHSAKGIMRGWSEEWNVAFAQITGGGEWPHAELNDSELRPGQLCAAFEFSRLIGNQYEQYPSMQVGAITALASSYWFSTSCQVDDHPPVFSLDGRLIGVTAKNPPGRDCSHTPTELLREMWEPLTEGKNVDRFRLVAHEDKNERSNPVKKDTPVEAEPEEQLPATIESAAAATVRIRPDSTRGEDGVVTKRGWSGVILSADGYIATCAHHHRMPGEQVTVYLPDGRDLRGQILGMNPISDVGLVKITEEAAFPHAELGDSASLSADSACWLIGYPVRRTDRIPLVRKSAIATNGMPWSSTLYTDKNVESYGGDSGGGVFDSAGRLIAIHEGKNPGNFGRHRRIEVIKSQWDFLSAGTAIDVPETELFAALRTAFPNIDRLRQVVVEVIRDGEPCVLGTIIGRDGLILTKASECYGRVAVRFPSGETLPAVIRSFSHPHDLALLKVDKGDLPVPEWSDSYTVTPGSLIGVAITGKTPIIGVVSHGIRRIPIDHGGGLSDLKDSAEGLKVVDDSWMKEFNLPIRVGDILTSVEGHPTPDLASYLTLLGDSNEHGQLIVFAGDPVTATVKRDNETVSVRFPYPAAAAPRPRNESPRYSGFPGVFDTDVTIEPKLCGGPVFDSTGRAIGVTIASRREWGGQTHVIPRDTIRRFLRDESESERREK